MANLDQGHKLLDGGYPNMPQPQFTDKFFRYVYRELWRLIIVELD